MAAAAPCAAVRLPPARPTDNLRPSLSHSPPSVTPSLGGPIHPQWWSCSDFCLPSHLPPILQVHALVHARQLSIYLAQCLYSTPSNWQMDGCPRRWHARTHTRTNTPNKGVAACLLQVQREHDFCFTFLSLLSLKAANVFANKLR